ncbi:MAG: hypothetical protein IKW13_08670 [Thermoguttaceae bacterium]|nr:hypothetical protein [Thermoguttaceae bacterium]
MAKAKKAGIKLEDIKRNYFWIVLPLVVVIAFVFTMLAKGKIKKAYVEKSEAVQTEKKSVDSIAGNNKHPNDKTIAEIEGVTDVLKTSVFDAWGLMYDDQKERNRWPRQLSREFLDLVEKKLKFRDPIGVGRPDLLEDYGYFIANHLPDLLKKMQRRRVQVKEYKLLKKAEMDHLGITGLEERFWPVYVSTDADGAQFCYVGILSDPEKEDSPLADVYLYDVKKDLVSACEDSALRDQLKAKEREPFYREVDPWIATPKDYMEFGATVDASAIMAAISGTDAMGGASGGSSMMSGGSSMSGGASGGSGGARGSMEGGPGSMGGDSSAGGAGSGAIPGNGLDPAEDQVAGTSLEGLAGGMATGRCGMGGGAAAGGPSGGARGGMSGGAGRGGMGGAVTEDPSWSQQKYPGLPPYKERRRVVGNVDWPNPEIYTLPTWESEAYPKSIEVWYAQETLWVYEALISVVAETNKDYDTIAKAPVKCVENMLIGQQAATEWGTLKTTIGDLTGASAANAMGDMMGSSSMMMSSPSMGSTGTMGSSSSGGSAEMQAADSILMGRYLDLEGKPLLASDKPSFAEFNMMPVCLKVVIDQRRVPELLVSCANSAMPIDVKHIRVCPDNNEPFTMPVETTASADMMGMGGSSMMGSSMGGPGGSSGGSGGARGSMDGAGGPGGSEAGGVEIGRSELGLSEYGADAIRVEVFGVINIYNEPNKDAFGTGKEAQAAENAADVALTEAGAAENQAVADEIAAAEAEAEAATDANAADAENATEPAATETTEAEATEPEATEAATPAS